MKVRVACQKEVPGVLGVCEASRSRTVTLGHPSGRILALHTLPIGDSRDGVGIRESDAKEALQYCRRDPLGVGRIRDRSRSPHRAWQARTAIAPDPVIFVAETAVRPDPVLRSLGNGGFPAADPRASVASGGDQSSEG